MVREYEAPIRKYPFSFELVMLAYHRRFPTCPLIPEILESEIIYQFESEDKSINVTERRFKVSIEAPYILKKLSGVEFFYCISRNSLDRANRTLLIECRNESFSSRVAAFETCKYSVSNENPEHTIFEQKACLEIKNFYGFETLAENVCIKAYSKSLTKTEKLIYDFIELLATEGITTAPMFQSILENKPAGSKISLDEISFRNPLSSNSISTDMKTFFDEETKNLSSHYIETSFSDDYFRKYFNTLSLLEQNSICLLHKKIQKRDDEIPNLVFLYKFLISCEGDLEKTYESLVKHLNWRRQNSISLITTWKLPTLIEPYFKGCWHHHDVDGSPLFIMRLGCMDIKGLLKSIGPDGMAKTLIKICEEGNILCENATREKDKLIMSWTLLVELGGFSLKNAWKPILQTLLRLIEVLQTNYPESLHRILIIKAPKFFGVIWGLISAFIKEETTKKFCILSHEHLRDGKLKEYIPSEFIPVWLGGKAKCRIDEDHLLVPKLMYIYKDHIESDFFGNVCIEDLYKKIIVTKTHTIEVPIDVNHDESVITWDFDVLEGDVVFSLLYAPKPSTLSSMVSLVLSTTSYENLDNNMPILYKEGCSIQGSHYCTRSGTYYLTWKFEPSSIWIKRAVVIYYFYILPHHQIESSFLSLRSSVSNVSAIDDFSLNGENYSVSEHSMS